MSNLARRRKKSKVGLETKASKIVSTIGKKENVSTSTPV